MAAEDTKSARETMEKSRLDVIECEEEIKSIKDALKSLAMGSAAAGADDKSSLNQLKVSVHKVKKAGAAADDDDKTDDNTLPTTFKIHLSSPIETNTITQLYDPLNPTAPGSIAKFESIETSNALLTVEVYTKDELMKLGGSAPHDLLPLCEDMGKGGGVEKKSSMLEIAIVAEGGMDDVVVEEEEVVSEAKEEAAETTAEGGGGGAAETTTEDVESEPSWEDAVAEEEKEGGETKEEEGTPPQSDEKEDDETKDTPAKDDDAESEELSTTKSQEEGKTKTTTPPTLQLPIYTLTVQLEYTPSANDRRDALYVQLNEVSKRKVAAIESLRKQAGIISRAKAATSEASSPSSPTKGGKAVKAGFLNKSKGAAAAAEEKKQPPFWKRWYEKTIGPKSMLWVVGPIAKNYVIFVGASLFIHFKGDLLALPPPV